MKTLMGLFVLAVVLCWQAAPLAAQNGDKPAAPAGDAAAKTDDGAKAEEKPADETAKKGDDAPAQPAGNGKDEAKPSVPPPITCVVKSATGTVEWRATEDAKWQPLSEGDQLPLGADICTGFRAKCTLVFDDESSVVEIQPLTTLRIGEFEKKNGKVRTRIYLMQGSTQSVVEKSRFQSDFAIVTPEITMAVRGSQNIGVTQHSDRGPLVTLTIRGLIVVYDNRNGRVQYVMPRNTVVRGLGMPIQNLRFGSAVPMFNVHGGLTLAELLSLLNGPPGFVGPGGQNAPNGGNMPGGGNPRLRQLIKFLNEQRSNDNSIIHEWECE